LGRNNAAQEEMLPWNTAQDKLLKSIKKNPIKTGWAVRAALLLLIVFMENGVCMVIPLVFMSGIAGESPLFIRGLQKMGQNAAQAAQRDCGTN